MAVYLVDKRFADLGIELAAMDEDSKVVLMQDGVYLGVPPIEGKMKVYYVENDLAKRGIDKLPSGASMINYDELIDLIEKETVRNFM